MNFLTSCRKEGRDFIRNLETNQEFLRSSEGGGLTGLRGRVEELTTDLENKHFFAVILKL